MANYSQQPQFWPPPPYPIYATQPAPVQQTGSHQQAQTMAAFTQNQSLPTADLHTIGANAPQYAAFWENFTKAGGFPPVFPPPPIGANGLPLPPPPPFIPPMPLQYDPLQHPGGAHHQPPIPVAAQQHTSKDSAGPLNPRVSEVKSQDKEDGELSDAEQGSPGKPASRAARVHSPHIANEDSAATQRPPSSILHNRPLDRPNREHQISPPPSYSSNDGHGKTERRDWAKDFLQLLHRNGVDQRALVKEGLNIGILRELYGELGISFPPEKAIQLVSAITNEATKASKISPVEALRPSTTPAQPMKPVDVEQSDETVATNAMDLALTSQNPRPSTILVTKPESVSKPRVDIPVKPPQAEDTRSPSASTPTNDRSAYIARLQAARSKKSAPTIAQPSQTKTNSSTSIADKLESVEKSSPAVGVASGPETVPSAAQQQLSTVENARHLDVAPGAVDEKVTPADGTDPVGLVAQIEAEKPTELSEAERKKQQQNEFLRQKLAQLKAMQAAKSSASSTASPAVDSKDHAARTPSSAMESLVSGNKPGRVEQADAQPDLLAVANPEPAHKTPTTVSPAPVNARRKRPTASDFDDAPSSSSAGSVKRPFGFGRSSMEHEYMVIEVSDDDVGMDIDDEDDGPEPVDLHQNVNDPNQRQLGSMPSITETSSRHQRNIATPSGLSTPSAQTPGGSSQQYANLSDHEKAIEDLRRKIAVAEGNMKKNAKKPAKPPAVANDETLRVKIQSVAETTPSVESAQMSMHPHVPEVAAIATPANPQPPVKQAETQHGALVAENNENLQIKTDQEPLVGAQQTDELRQKIQDLERKLALAEAQSAKHLESKTLLLRKLESLGVPTDGMSHADLQTAKDIIVEQRPGIFEDAATPATQAIIQPAEFHAPGSTSLDAKQPWKALRVKAGLPEASNIDVTERADEQRVWQRDVTPPGLSVASEVAHLSTQMAGSGSAQQDWGHETTAVEPSDEEMEEYSPDMVMPAMAENTSVVLEQRDDDGDQESISDVYDFEPDNQPIQATQPIVENDAYTGYVSSAPEDDDDFYSPEPVQAQEKQGKAESIATPASGLQSDDYLGDMTPLTDHAKDANAEVAADDELDFDEDRMSTSSDSDVYEASVLPAQAVLPAGASTHTTSTRPTSVSHMVPGSTPDDATEESDDDMEYDPANALPTDSLLTAAQALETTSPSPSDSATSEEAVLQSDSDIGRLEIADDVAVGSLAAPALDETAPERLATAQAPSSQLAPGSGAHSGTKFFTPYNSALRSFKAYRFHPGFTQDVSGGFKSLTYSHNIKSNQPLCKFEAMGGTCNDNSCEDQHFRDMRIADDKILLQLGTANPGRTEEEKDRWKAGLRQVLAELRSKKARDPTVVAQAIASYRREFLQDSSRVLDLDIDFIGSAAETTSVASIQPEP